MKVVLTKDIEFKGVDSNKIYYKIIKKGTEVFLVDVLKDGTSMLQVSDMWQYCKPDSFREIK